MICQFVLAEIDAVRPSMTVEHVQFVSCIKITDLSGFVETVIANAPKIQFQVCRLDRRPRSGNRKNSTQTQQFRATARSGVTQYYSGRGMERVHLEFYSAAHIRILAHYIRHLTYVVLVTDFRQALILLQYPTHRAIL